MVSMAKVLVVDDEVAIAKMIADLLALEHHCVDIAHDGAEALHLVKLAPYDLLILDWELPNSSGIEICKAYRDRGGRAPVLLLTGKNTIPDKEKGLDSGADDYLTKPFDVRELSARVRALIRRVGRRENVSD